MHVFWRSLLIVGIAELFDKTWFMGLLLAMKYPVMIVFAGSFAALFLHTVLAAAFGYAFARFISPVMLNIGAALIFTVFAVMYAKDWYYADPDGDAIAAGKEDAADDCNLEGAGRGHEGHELLSPTHDDGLGQGEEEGRVMGDRPSKLMVLTQSFVGVFIAECGDRTQIAMIGQHASQPLVPVFLGSVLAFFLLAASAVGVAAIANDLKLSERLVHGVSAICFAAFAILAIKDTCVAMKSVHDTAKPP